MDQKRNDQVTACIARAEELLLNEKLQEAFALVNAAADEHDHVRLWRFKKRVLLMMGDEEAARGLMTRIIDVVHRPTPSELSLVGSRKSSFTLLKDRKLFYLHVPKCGSTTVKDMLYHILKGRTVEGHSHTKMLEEAPYRIIDRGRLQRDFSDWFKFLVVRDPISRLRSYYRFNLVFANDLAQEVGKRESYLGLKLQPSYREFLEKLPEYRRVFRTLRAHTNGVADIAGDDPSVFDWVGPVKDMGALRERLCELTGTSIPSIHNFRSKDLVAFDPAEDLEDKVRSNYTREYEVYGRYF